MEKRIRSRKAKWFALGALALATVVLWNRLAPDEVQKRLDQIREAGWPVNCDDLNAWYEEPPPGKNAADYFLQAITAHVSPSTNVTNLPFWSLMSSPKVFPKPLNLTNFTHFTYLGLASLPDPNAPLPSATRQEIRDYLSKNQTAIDLLKQGVSLNHCRFPVDFTKGPSALLPHLVGIRNATKLLMLDTLRHIERGGMDQAATSFCSALRIADLTGREPTLPSCLAANSCRRIACDLLNWWLSVDAPPRATIETLRESLEKTKAESSIKDSIILARCQGVFLYQQPAGKVVDYISLNANFLGNGIPSLGPPPIDSFFKKLMIGGSKQEDALFYLNAMEQYLEAMEAPYPMKLSLSNEVGRKAQQRKQEMSWHHIITQKLLLPIEKFVFGEARLFASLHSAQTALALELFRLDHGRLPGTFNELAPDYLEKTLQDPFTGEPLRYRYDGSAYVIYSLGPDGEDAHQAMSFDEMRVGKAIEDDVSFFVK